jgi:DNA (cytosine-5)-methyltransferase 1
MATLEDIGEDILEDTESPERSFQGFTAVDLFSGCGGSSLGLKLAGFRELFATDWDDHAAKIFRLNFPEIYFHHGDIAKLSGKKILKIINLKPGELDLLTGSPPCQGFSMTGERKFSDPRNMLFKEYLRILDQLKPKTLIIENVPGMIKGAMKHHYLKIISLLRTFGYEAKGEVMNSKYYNVPQSRERIIIIGIRKDLCEKYNLEPTHPKPQTKPISFRQAVNNLIIPADEPKFLATQLMRDRFSQLKPGETKADQNHGWYRLAHIRINWDDCVTTVLTSEKSLPVHPEEDRRLLVCEVMRLASFPDDFKLTGGKLARITRIGNSVPPNLMKAIALHIRQNILEKCLD